MLPEQLQQMEANADQMILALSEQAAPPTGEDQSSVATSHAEAAPSTDASQTDAGVAPGATSDLSAEIAALKQQAFNADQRWRSLQGMLDKKDQENDTLRTLLAQLSERQSAPASPPAPTVHVTQEDRDQFGDEWLSAATRVAEDTFERRMRQFESQVIAPLMERLTGFQQTVSSTVTATFEDRLTSRVPNWREQNVDAGFLTWLGDKAPYRRETKLQVLKEAYQNQDLETVVQMFLDYKGTTPTPAPKPDPSHLVAPSRPKATPTASTLQPQGRIWTGADITKLYRDYEKKLISHEEYMKQERDLFAAQQEGRIAY